MNDLKSGILIIGYNRLDSIKRVLKSVKAANYYGDKIDLIISIDYSGLNDVQDYVKSIEWEHGDKVLRFFEERQGLKKHILSCGEFLKEYDCLAVLEDDVIVSPSFYSYMKESVAFYENDEKIAGISLYSYEFNMNSKLPFVPEKSNYDVYFLQYAQSWGQIWMKKSFLKFLDWVENNNFEFTNTTPQFVNSWPDKSSWLKLHIKYCVDNDLYFVYPYKSYSTCFSDPGEHVEYKSTLQQVSFLRENSSSSFNFIELNKASIKYDVFFERIIDKDDLLIDIYGTKTDLYNGYKYVLTTNQLDYKIIDRYSLDMRPHELNYIMNIKGEGLFLYDLSEKSKNKFKYNVNVLKYGYYYNQEPESFKKMVNVVTSFFLIKIRRKIKKYLNNYLR